MVSKKKVEGLKKINELLKDYKSILLFDLNKLPSKQLHEIRNKLKEEEIYTLIQKKRSLEFGLKENNLNINSLKQPAIIYSNKPIFSIVKTLRRVKVKRKAKVGEVINSDIEINSGNTEIQAGPAIAIFKQFKIQTIIKNGKIVIKEPKVICRSGEEINSNLVSLLNMLHIEPLELTIQPELGYSQNIAYNKSVLELDENYFKEKISTVTNNLFKLTVNIGYPTKENISLLLQKTWQNTKNLGLNLKLPVKELLPDLVRTAYLKANKLNSEVSKNIND